MLESSKKIEMLSVNIVNHLCRAFFADRQKCDQKNWKKD